MGLLSNLTQQQQGPIVRTMVVYCKKPDDSLQQQIIAKFAENSMEFEFHPQFSFDTIAGWLPVKICTERICEPELRGKIWKTGFELFVDEFNFEKDFPRQQKGFFKKKDDDNTPRVSEELDPILAECDTVMTFNIEDSESLGLRTGVMTAAFIAELTGGVFLNATSHKWRKADVAVVEMMEAVANYEGNIGNWHVRAFTQW